MNIFSSLIYKFYFFIKSANYRNGAVLWITHRYLKRSSINLTLLVAGHRILIGGWRSFGEYVMWRGQKVAAGEMKIITAATSQQNSICLDVGGNIGLYALVMAACGAKQVHTFEPVKENYDRLLYNLELNSSLKSRIELIRCAVSDKIEALNVLFDATSPGKSKVVPLSEEKGLDSITLDDYCATNGIEYIDLLKIDVEGFEMAVMRGAYRMLNEKRVAYILFESLDDYLADYGSDRKKQWELLDNHSYTIKNLDGDILSKEKFCQSGDVDFYAQPR